MTQTMPYENAEPKASARAMSEHRCHAFGCNVEVPPRMLACRDHWRAIRPALRSAVWREFRSGQERDKNPSSRYMAVQRLALAELAGKAQGAQAAEAATVLLEHAQRWRRRAIDQGAGDPLVGLLGSPRRPAARWKALSIRQPWIWAIFHGGKRVENREWAGCGFRGTLLLHVGKTCTRKEYALGVESIALARAELGLPAVEVPPLKELDRGGLIGVCRLVGARHLGDDARGYEVAGTLGLDLADVRPLPLLPFTGALGFFDVREDELTDEYREALAAMGAS